MLLTTKPKTRDAPAADKRQALVELAEHAEAIVDLIEDASAQDRLAMVKALIKAGDMPTNDFRLLMRGLAAECRK